MRQSVDATSNRHPFGLRHVGPYMMLMSHLCCPRELRILSEKKRKRKNMVVGYKGLDPFVFLRYVFQFLRGGYRQAIPL